MSLLLATAIAVLGLLVTLRYSRESVWLLLLWVPVMGWFQLNVFNDSTVTVLLYEFLMIGIYLAFAFHALRAPESMGPPRLVWLAVPFAVWVLLLTPRSIEIHGALLPAMALRTYLLPLPLVWIGYRAFTTRRQVEGLGWLLMLQMIVIAAVTASQFLGFTTGNMPGTMGDIPRGFVLVGVLRPPGTFSSPGLLGIYVLFAITFAVGLLGLRVAQWKRLVFLAGLAAGVVTLIINTQRAAMVLLLATLPLMIAVARGRRAAVTAITALTVIGAGGFLGSQVAGDAFITRFTSITQDVAPTLIDNPTRALDDAMRTPFLGIGLGTAVPGSQRLVMPNFASIIWNARVVIGPEQYVAALVYQTGVPGLLLYLLFIGAILYHSLQAVNACRGTDMALLAAAIFSFQVAILLDSWAYNPLDTPPARILFWFWSGVLLNLPRLAAASAAQAPAPYVAPVRTRRLAQRPLPQRVAG